MEKFNYKREIILWILLVIPFIYIAVSWGELPDRVPIHFDIHGQVNDWGSKGMIFLMPGSGIIVYLLLLFLPKIDPKKMSYEFFHANFFKIRVVISVFLFALSMFLVHISQSNTPDAHMIRFIPISALLLITVMGNFMINIKPNWFVGIRTPWTLSSDDVWKKTHLILGRIWFYGGLICTILAFIVGDNWLPAVIITFTLGSALFAVIYSYILFRKEKTANTSNS